MFCAQGMKSDSGRDVSVDLFRHMGISCPNLKILDLTQAIAIAGDSLVHLFFHDGYTSLHQVRIGTSIHITQLIGRKFSNVFV